ncbi:MAG: hypothetical protein K2Q45_00525, partial [Nitrosomonas sp.]|nr:hypothetical protein [Nitrosomonas sp.]
IRKFRQLGQLFGCQKILATSIVIFYRREKKIKSFFLKKNSAENTPLNNFFFFAIENHDRSCQNFLTAKKLSELAEFSDSMEKIFGFYWKFIFSFVFLQKK